RNVHVRIDFVSSRLSARARSWVEIGGLVCFAIPFCWLLIELSLPLVADSLRSGEVSPNAGGLIRWPVYALVPLAMALLLLQCLSELVKHLAFLRGRLPAPAFPAEGGGAAPARSTDGNG